MLGSNFGFELGTQDPLGSQRSLFPWDNAGASSSVNGAAMNPFGERSDRISVGYVDAKMRGISLSRRESSLVPSQVGSGIGGVGFSPAVLGNGYPLSGEDFAFERE